MYAKNFVIDNSSDWEAVEDHVERFPQLQVVPGLENTSHFALSLGKQFGDCSTKYFTFDDVRARMLI